MRPGGSVSVSVALGGFLALLLAGNVLLLLLLGDGPARAPPAAPGPPAPPAARAHLRDHLRRLAAPYRARNVQYEPLQRRLLRSFNSSRLEPAAEGGWPRVDSWIDNETEAPNSVGLLLQAMKTSKIVLADNAQKGTQLKLLFLLENKQKLFFKPKRYNIDNVINGNIYAGFDRHNSEVLGYYLATVLNIKWVAPSVIRKLNIGRDIVPVATPGLLKTMINKGHSEWCLYGKCYYCKVNETVCGDNNHELEGAAILYLDKPFRVNKSPWRRSYGARKMEWETNDLYCKKVKTTITSKRLLDLVDTAIFDFLIQNGDRHRYEVYKDNVILLDNGKGLGNPWVDELDILAPLYQCCIIRQTTWQHLELLSGGALTQTIKTLSSMQGDQLATEEHYLAIERRLLIVYATVQMCIGKHGGAKVFI